MSKGEMINSLDSISSFNSYSKNGILFEQVIKYRSLKTLVNKLKHPIKLTKMSFLEKFKSKYPYDSTTSGIPDEYFSDTIYKIGKEDENENKELIIPENKSSNNKYVKRDYNFKKMNNNDYINNDPFKYHPNYNSIYKNVPSTKFFLSNKKYLVAKNKVKIHKNLLLLNKNLNEQNKSKASLIKETNSHDSEESKNDSLSKKKINEKEILTNIKYFSNRNNSKFLPNIKHRNRLKIIKNSLSEGNLNVNIANENKQNYTPKFSKYFKRNFNIKQSNNILSYQNLENSISTKSIKAIDFKKMKPHSLKYLLNTNIIKNPSICYYEPNYDAFVNKKYVIFNPNKKGKKNKSLQKIWSCYDVRKEYMSVDNEKLNKGINKKLYEMKMQINK